MDLRLGAPPFAGAWSPVVGPWLVPAVLGAGLLTVMGPRLAERLRWRHLLLVTPAAAGAWALLLALSSGDGLDAITAPLTTRWEYLAAVGDVTTPSAFLREFTDRVADLPLHARSHPPTTVLLFWAIDRIGLDGAGWATGLVLTVGAAGVSGVLVALREVGGESVARRAAPFLVAVPAVLWVATSVDALFMGVGAWAVALLVLASGQTGRRSFVLAAAGGVLCGVAVMLSYGIVLLALVPAGVVAGRRRWDVAFVAAASLVAVVGAVAVAGFWWFDGLDAARAEYARGVASARPYGWFLLLNAAAAAAAVGPAAIAGLSRLLRNPARPTWWLLPAGALTALVVANLSGLSKGEVERIWLPFYPWLVAAAAALPAVAIRRWLATSAATGIALQALLRSPW